MTRPAFFWRKGLWACMSLFFLASVGLAALYLYLQSQLPNVDSLKQLQLQVPLRIYTQEGQLIQEYGEKKRIPLSYEQIPKTLIQAVLATEDQRFFDHSGVDMLGLARATMRMIQTGTKSQGGSTITMQVARNFFLDRKKTFLRKFNEILLAIKIDRELSKEKILELYLNKIYLGNRAYGVGAAAQIYYAKPLNELSLAQLAMIAGLPQAPSTQNPIVNPTAAKNRRDHVLERLYQEKYISQQDYDKALQEPVDAVYHGGDLEVPAPFVAEMIRQSLYDHFGQDAYTKGYKVYTTISGKLQAAANQSVEDNLLAYDRRHGYRGPLANLSDLAARTEKARHAAVSSHPNVADLEPGLIIALSSKSATALKKDGQKVEINWAGMAWAKKALRKGFVGQAPRQAKDIFNLGDIVYLRKKKENWELSQLPEVESALVAMNPQNGAIQALVGGFDFAHSKFNRATQSSRQPGSSIKPFIYAAALSKGYSLASIVNDSPIVVDDPGHADLWRPHNDNKQFMGPIRLKEGLAHSRNMVSIRILDDIGLDYAIDYLTKFGFRKENIPKGLSLALGTLSASPMDMSAAFAIFANGGYKVEPYLIDHITNNEGKLIFQAKPLAVCDHCEQSATDNKTMAPRVIPADIAFLMDSALKAVIEHGTAHAASSLNRKDIAGKTGTTNDQVDAWFAGYNPNLVVTSWVGYDTPQPLHEYAAALALPLWIDFMKIALQGVPVQERKPPENIVAVRINPKSGMLAGSHEPDSVLEYFREEEVPGMEEAIPEVSFQTSQAETKTQEALF